MFDEKSVSVFEKVELIDQMTSVAVKLNALNVDIRPLTKVIVSMAEGLVDDVTGKDGLYP